MVQMAYSSLALSLLAAVSVGAQVLTDFQVTEPPPITKAFTESCEMFLLEHTFGQSYYVPAVIDYTPPTNCGPVGSWAGIVFNFTVTSNGTQYDRLGVFSFHDVEIWRTSTAEPSPDGIIWTYLKDVTKYIPLFSEPGTMLLELDNLLETGLNGQYAATLTATFYASSPFYPAAGKANTIIPISSFSATSGEPASALLTTNVTLPTNAVQVYAELYASGNSEEEEWYYNVPNEYYNDVPSGYTFGNGPFREVRLLVDGQVAGVAFPYAVIFTGGINPACWAPIASYGAMDQPTYFIDLTPFVPILADGASHNISIDVSSAETDHTIDGNWYVTGSLQVVTGTSSKPTTGKITYYDAEPYAVTSTTGDFSDNELNFTVKASRSIRIESTVISGDGQVNYVVFEQNLSFENSQYYLNNFSIQNVVQTASGSFLSTHNGIPVLTDNFEYPLTVDLTYFNPEATSFYSYIDHAYYRELLPTPFILGTTINNHQIAGGYFVIADSGNYGNGTSNNTFSYVDLKGSTYDAQIDAAYNVITTDEQSGSLAPKSYPSFPWTTTLWNIATPRLPGRTKIY